MGALTSNRKRGDEYLTFNHGPPSPNPKRPRLGSSPSINPNPTPSLNSNSKPVSSKSAIARVSSYPDLKHPLTRIHAPCRNHKFALSSDPNPRRVSMGNALFSKLAVAKNYAYSTFRYVGSQLRPEAPEPQRVGGNVDNDSGVEEIEVINDDDDDDVVVVVDVDDDSRFETPLKGSELVDEIGSLSLDVGPESVSAYKKLLFEAKKRTPRLEELKFNIEVAEQQRDLFQSLRPVKKIVEEIPREPFIPLTKDEENEVQRAFSASNRRKVLVSHENSSIDITGQVLLCLRPGAWLNDEVINVYLELLKEREKRDPKKYLKCHFFNTFFYKKLTAGGGYDYKAVRRWTTQRKIGYGLGDCEKIFVPIHREIHWCLAVINKKDQKFQYLDSLGGVDSQVLQALARYYADEVKDKTGKEVNLSSWTQEFVQDLPEQLNGYDCGVFMIKYADFYSRGLRLCFSQDHMPYFRVRTVKEILRLRAD